MAEWLLAWDRFALAAAMVDMMPWRTSWVHRQNVVEVGSTPIHDSLHHPCVYIFVFVQVMMDLASESDILGRKPYYNIGSIYDRMCQDEWVELAERLPDFNIDKIIADPEFKSKMIL